MSYFRASSASLHLLSFGRSRFFSSSSFEKLVLEPKSGLIGTGHVTLPRLLQDSLTRCLSEFTPRQLRKDVAQLSATLRAKTSGKSASEVDLSLPESSGEGLLEADIEWMKQEVQRGSSETRASPFVNYDDSTSAAYVASRMPAAYAAIFRVLQEVGWRLPEFAPTSVLDYGSGPGTCAWAVREVWPTAVKRSVIVETSSAMTRMAASLGQGVQDLPPPHRFASLEAASRKLRGPSRQFDLVIAAYSLGEVGSREEQEEVVRRLWGHTGGMLVLIEAGNPRGGEAVQRARAQILLSSKKIERKSTTGEAGKGAAHVVAPCAHDGVCPMAGTVSWCHFVQRLQRPPTQRSAKRQGEKMLREHEDERFAFVVLRRGLRPNEESSEPQVTAGTEEALHETGDDISADLHAAAMSLDPLQKLGEEIEKGEDEDEGEGEEEEEEGEEVEGGGEGRSHPGVSSRWARIVRKPRRRGNHVILDLCRAVEGCAHKGCLERVVVTKRGDRQLYQTGRRAKWGDLWERE